MINLFNAARLFVLVIVIFGTHWITYKHGLVLGEQQYKQSHRIYMALQSAYNFGYLDAKQGKSKSWDGPDSHSKE